MNNKVAQQGREKGRVTRHSAESGNMRGIERKGDGEKRRNEISRLLYRLRLFDIKMGAKTIMNDL